MGNILHIFIYQLEERRDPPLKQTVVSSKSGTRHYLPSTLNSTYFCLSAKGDVRFT